MVVCFSFLQIAIATERLRPSYPTDEPVAVATADGIIQSVDRQAQGLGVQNGQTATSARSLCPGLIVLPYDRAAYEQAAEPLWDALAVESSVVEPDGPEFCYLEMTGPDTQRRVQNLAILLAESSGMPVTAGIGATKLIARRAAQLQKAPGRMVTSVPSGDEAIFLSKGRLASLGAALDPKLLKELSRLGVDTFGDLRRIPRNELERRFKRLAYRLSRIAGGLDDDPVRALWPPPRIESRFAFDDETNLLDLIHTAVRQCAGRISADLISGNRYCRSLTLTAQLSDGTYVRENESLTLPMRDTASLDRAALRLLKRLHLESCLLEICLSASDLDIGKGVQLALLDDNDSARGYPHERKRNLEAATRHLRRKYGQGAVISAALLAQARRIGFWTHYLAKLRSEEVRVAADQAGRPMRYWRSKRRAKRTVTVDEYRVTEIVDSWMASGWRWGKVTETECFRVSTDPDGLCELHKLDGHGEWRLCGEMD